MAKKPQLSQRTKKLKAKEKRVEKRGKGAQGGKGARGGKGRGRGKSRGGPGSKGRGRSSDQGKGRGRSGDPSHGGKGTEGKAASRRRSSKDRPSSGATAKRGAKRKVGALAGSRPPRKAPKDKEAKVDRAAEDGEQKKKKKLLTPRQKRRKEVTKLYSELINPGRSRKATEIVSDIQKKLDERTSSLAQYCSKDIGSRVLQACLKWGSREQRRHLLNKLREDIPKLTVDRYGHVVVLKLLRYISRTSTQRKPTEEERKARAQNLREFLESFRGKNLHAAFYHRHGCRVINSIYFSEAVGTKEKRRILHEVAVPPAVALTRPELPGSRPLRQLLHDKDLTKDQLAAMMSHLREVAERAVDKELLGFDIVHLVFQAFCEGASESQLKDLAEKCMGGAPYLLSSKPGAEALLRLLGVATAKQRKDLCRELKGKFHALAMNGVDYVVMMRLAATVDDTVLLAKTMLAEWAADLPAICFDKYGHKVLAWVFRPDDPHLFSPYERACAALPAPSSVKAPETRRQELLRALKAPVRAVLLEGPLKAAADVHAKGLLVAYLAADWDGELVEALVAAAAREAAADEELGSLGSGTATTTLLTLLKLEPAGTDCGLALPLWQRCFEPRLPAVATSRCAFVLLALAKHGQVGKMVLAALKRRRKELEAAIQAAEAKGGVVAGARKLLSAGEEVGSA